MSSTSAPETCVYPRASAHGRFQPFHYGHLTYLLLAKARCGHLVIGITNPDPRHLRAHAADPSRHLPENNPFTYFERVEMIRHSLLDVGVSTDTFTVVPFPIDAPDLLPLYCPKVPVFMRNRGEWTAQKVALLTEHGWQTEILREDKDLAFSATDVRNRISAGTSWHDLVPRGTRTILDGIDVRGRILAAQRTEHRAP